MPHQSDIAKAEKLLDSADRVMQCRITRLAVVTYIPDRNESDIALIVARASTSARGQTLMVSERRQECARGDNILQRASAWVQDAECDGLAFTDHAGFIADYDVAALYNRGIRSVIVDVQIDPPIRPWILRELSDFPMIINVKLGTISQFDLMRLFEQLLPRNANVMGIVTTR